MNLQLSAILLIIILYPVGFWLAKRAKRMELSPIIGIPVLLLFLASLIYLLVSSWLLFLMVLGGGILILAGTALFDVALEAKQRSEIRDMNGNSLFPYLKGRFKEGLIITFILVGFGIYLLILSIIRSLR